MVTMVLSPMPRPMMDSFSSKGKLAVLHARHQKRHQEYHHDGNVVEPHGYAHDVLEQHAQSQVEHQKHPDGQKRRHVALGCVARRGGASALAAGGPFVLRLHGIPLFRPTCLLYPLKRDPARSIGDEKREGAPRGSFLSAACAPCALFRRRWGEGGAGYGIGSGFPSLDPSTRSIMSCRLLTPEPSVNVGDVGLHGVFRQD